MNVLHFSRASTSLSVRQQCDQCRAPMVLTLFNGLDPLTFLVRCFVISPGELVDDSAFTLPLPERQQPLPAQLPLLLHVAPGMTALLLPGYLPLSILHCFPHPGLSGAYFWTSAATSLPSFCLHLWSYLLRQWFSARLWLDSIYSGPPSKIEKLRQRFRESNVLDTFWCWSKLWCIKQSIKWMPVSQTASEHTERGKGACKACKKVVAWSRGKLGAHKRANCDALQLLTWKKVVVSSSQSPEETQLRHQWFNWRRWADSHSIHTDSRNKRWHRCSSCEIFLPNGNSVQGCGFRSFPLIPRWFVNHLNPAYAEEIPKLSATSGRLLHKEYANSLMQ